MSDLLTLQYRILPDGRTVSIHPVTPDIREDLKAAFERLSGRSRYQRFFGPLNHLTPKMLDYLTELDFERHMAFCAADEDDPERPGIGLARCIRSARDSDTAEIAITVIDDYQHRGVGRLLVSRLADYAMRKNIRRFRGSYLSSNKAIDGLLRKYGVESHAADHGIKVFEVPVKDALAWSHPRGPRFRQ